MRLNHFLNTTWVSALVLALTACGGGQGSQESTAGKAANGSPAASSAVAAASASSGAGVSNPGVAPPGPPVTVRTAVAAPQDVPVEAQASGTVVSLAHVDIRPQITSVVTKVHVKEGQRVRKGDLLFTLDTRSDEANVAKARAQAQRSAATLADARRQLDRSLELHAKGFVSQGAVDTNRAVMESAAAAVAADESAAVAAKVALSYGHITAPGAGQLGVINAVPGTLVTPGGTPMVTLTQMDPVAVSFVLPQNQLEDVRGLLKNGGAKVEVRLPGGGKALQGRLVFVDNVVDAASGSVKLKAQFANDDLRLWPGAFVQVRLILRELKGAIVIPQQAVVQSPRGRQVYVVGPDEKVSLKPVEQVYAFGQDMVVKGLQAGERLVVDGRQNVRPGAKVKEAGRP